MMSDIIADGLTRIRNAALRKLEVTKLNYSRLMEDVLKVFQEKGYIEGYKVIEDGNKKFINVTLKYDENGESVINEVKRISKPGRRVYKGYEDIKNFKNGFGTIVVSTNKGVLANDEAYRQKVGGEVICSIW
ncbi:small subunit ribosomal protein S8 [Lebetimonas natsushimae]|uniref:Small ribosomal subunit protein uS8 n=1 Tax=Lebetimonas natsushimae TaxID=1936991 RepID=A0A292YBK9_9BACT|nr:30S ribosomal protein S8 [Lebetimonas natsushimae]GAX86903.1 small subunit ribosomal protein S8 [Lebetimonas natsushimae]